MSSSTPEPKSKFTQAGVRDYERRRYRGLDQKIVHARETRLIRAMIGLIGRLEPGAANRLVLDVPCGYGRFSGLLAALGFEVVASDLSIAMARRAGERLSRTAIVANAIRGLPFKPGAFDAVFSIRFLHHVPEAADRAGVLGEFHRVAARWAVVTFYRLNGIHRVQRRLRRLLGKSRTNIKMIEPGLFETEARAAGFEVVRVRPLLRGIHAYHLALLRKT